MKNVDRWRKLGHKHVMWELLRYFLHLRSKKNQNDLLTDLKQAHHLGTPPAAYNIEKATANLLLDYLADRNDSLLTALGKLRTELEAKSFCETLGVQAGHTNTRNKVHHQSTKALVATVGHIAKKICHDNGTTVDTNPQTRCAWVKPAGLHVSSRNLDGAIPSTSNPVIIWEIKEYWGKTGGGSKMSDAVYECNLVGRELRDVENEIGNVCQHVVFIDGKEQWSTRKSDIGRLLDLYYQGLIDHLIVGIDVETSWPAILTEILVSTRSN